MLQVKCECKRKLHSRSSSLLQNFAHCFDINEAKIYYLFCYYYFILPFQLQMLSYYYLLLENISLYTSNYVGWISLYPPLYFISENLVSNL